MWSPELDTGVRNVQHWKSRKLNIDDDAKTKRLIGMAVELGTNDDCSKSKQAIQLELKQAYSGVLRTTSDTTEAPRETYRIPKWASRKVCGIK